MVGGGLRWTPTSSQRKEYSYRHVRLILLIPFVGCGEGGNHETDDPEFCPKKKKLMNGWNDG